MPEFGKEQAGSRKIVDPRDSFGWSTPNLKVAAHATDPYVKPAPDANIAAFVDTMKNLESATGGYISMQKAQKEGNQKRGITDAKTGKPMDDQAGLFNAGWGYQEAYNVTMGETRGLEYKTAHDKGLLENNHFQNEANPNEAYKKFNDELYAHYFTEVQGNPQLMFGASEQIKQAGVAGSIAMHDANFKTAKTAFTNGISRMQQDHLSVFAKSPQSEGDLANLRRIVSDEWELKVKPTNFMTRDQYSQTVVDNIGKVALSLAQDPTMTTSEAEAAARKLTSLYDAPDPDTKQSWSTMVDAEGKLKFRAEVDHYNSRLNAAITQREADDRKALKLKSDVEARDLFVNVVLDTNLTYQQKQAAITAAKFIDASEMQTLVAKAEVFQKEEKHIIQNFPAINKIRESIEMTGSIPTLEALRRKVTGGYGTILNAETAKELQHRITGRIDHVKSEGRANTTLAMEQKKMGWDILQKVVGTASLSDLDGTQAAMRIDTYGRMFFGRVNAGENPTDVSEALIGTYAKAIGKTPADVHGPSKYTSAADIQAAVKSGKMRPDEGVLELKKFLSQKPAAPTK